MESANSRLPEAVYSADQVRELDRIAIEEFGIPGYTLMCRAGEAAVAALRRRWPAAQSVAVYCGAGNNAGDGYVVARLAVGLGLSVRVIAVVPPDRLSGDAARAWKDYRKQGGSFEPFDAGSIPEEDVLVDGLLGSGLDRDLRGGFLAAVTAMEAAGRPVLSLDIPTGLHADTGLPLGGAVHADLTVTFVGLKQGLFLGEGANHRGALEFAGLGIPPAAHDRVEAPIRRITRAPTCGPSCRPGRGSRTRGTQAVSCWWAAARACPAPFAWPPRRRFARAPDWSGWRPIPIRPVPVMAGRAEAMCVAIEDAPQLDPWLQAVDGVVLGPGLGQSAWARSVWERVLESDLPLVVDADGLNLLAEAGRAQDKRTARGKRTARNKWMARGKRTARNKWMARGKRTARDKWMARGKWILTPHPGEAARLLGTSTREIQADRADAVARIADRFRGVAVLKGAGTLVAAPDEVPIGLCDRGNPGMATAGMGDVLAGILGGLLVQSGNMSAVARAGVRVHAACGDAAAQNGERGLLAGDLMEHIRSAANPKSETQRNSRMDGGSV